MKKIILILMIMAVSIFAESVTPFTGKINQLKQILDPVYNMPINPKSKWVCEAILKNGNKAQFVSVKSMMQVIFHSKYFIKHKLLEDEIDKTYVKDFISGQKIEANKAVYVFGSNLVGPHGDDLIPFSSEANAKIFMMKSGGTKILPYARLTKGLIRYLDM